MKKNKIQIYINGKKKNINIKYNLINILEDYLGKKADMEMLPIQPGDVEATWASNELLYQLTAFRPKTRIETGLKAYVDWFKTVKVR